MIKHSICFSYIARGDTTTMGKGSRWEISFEESEQYESSRSCDAQKVEKRIRTSSKEYKHWTST